MKREVNGFAVAIVLCFGLLLCALIVFKYLDTNKPEPHETYANCGCVTCVDYENDLVSVTDFGGFVWQFFGCEDWDEGDICAMVMDDNGTPDNIMDDIVMNTNYCGWSF